MLIHSVWLLIIVWPLRHLRHESRLIELDWSRLAAKEQIGIAGILLLDLVMIGGARFIAKVRLVRDMVAHCVARAAVRSLRFLLLVAQTIIIIINVLQIVLVIYSFRLM